MNVVIRINVVFEERDNEVVVKLLRLKGGKRLGAFDVVGMKSFKIRFWDTELSVCKKVNKNIRKLIKTWMNERKMKDKIHNHCRDFSLEQYTIVDKSLEDLLKK